MADCCEVETGLSTQLYDSDIFKKHFFSLFLVFQISGHTALSNGRLGHHLQLQVYVYARKRAFWASALKTLALMRSSASFWTKGVANMR